ncbi:hypothetical protein BY996DRAFT_6410543 [Phakopsora pachyrhizi]|nr:hypothetical protein BY996DRAFT_6410543 [Phakopsora pachyrhizi]
MTDWLIWTWLLTIPLRKTCMDQIARDNLFHGWSVIRGRGKDDEQSSGINLDLPGGLSLDETVQFEDQDPEQVFNILWPVPDCFTKLADGDEGGSLGGKVKD